MRSIRLKAGFTIAEVLIATLILSVLAGLALPAYSRTIEQSRINEVTTTLSIIHMGEKIYRLNNGTYWDGGTLDLTNAGNLTTINTALNIDIAPTFYTDLVFSGVTAGGYTAKINRNATQGGNTGWWYQYTYAGVGAPTETHNP